MRSGLGTLGRLAALATVAATVAVPLGSIARAGAVVAPPPSVVSVGDVTVREGHTKTRTVHVGVTLDVPAGTTQTVRYAVTGGTATTGAATQASTTADAKAASGTLSFSATAVTKYVSVVVYGDTRSEADETVAVTLSNPSAGLTIGRAVSTVTIRDDEATPGVVASIGSVTAVEGDAGTRVLHVPVTLSAPAAGAVVRFHLAPQSAAGGWKGSGVVPLGADFADKGGATQSATFAGTTVAKLVSVSVAPDLDDESDETFRVVLESTSVGALGDTGVATILDDDPAAGDGTFGPGGLVGSLAPGSVLVACGQAAAHLVLTVSSHLDPACTYTGGIEVTASNVTLDCRGAALVRAPGVNESGIRITAPTTTALSNVVVRNCNVSGFPNNLRITRSGFKDLAAGAEYVNGFSNIRIENNTFDASRNSGVFVDGYVTGVTITRTTVSNSGGVGIYLEAGSTGTVIERSVIRHNGYGDVVPGPASAQLGATTVYYLSTGREGVAVDGSRDNLIHRNVIEQNSAGGIMLYKNCGEDAGTTGHWVRRYGSTGNRIRHNVLRDQPNGVWIASRAAENQYFMSCSDTPLVDTPATLTKVFLDPVVDTAVEFNVLDGNVNGIRVEGDGATLKGNTIEDATRGVLLGTKVRTSVAGQPVTGTVITGNSARSTTQPYGWVWGKGTTTFTGNASGGVTGKLLAGTQPTINAFLFVVQFVPAP